MDHNIQWRKPACTFGNNEVFRREDALLYDCVGVTQVNLIISQINVI
jgi:hypothetical protein